MQVEEKETDVTFSGLQEGGVGVSEKGRMDWSVGFFKFGYEALDGSGGVVV